ncbi:HNHc domain-containing protein [Fusarium sp. Ph1]|nr:HNHc domain-containing protein [Fusarium sp. Ph1]
MRLSFELKDESSDCHFEAGCVHRISELIRRLEPRYMPPKKASNSPRYATYPLRKTVWGRKPASPSKGSASGSVSPRKDPDIDQADEDFANMVAPPECNISDERAKITMANFRSSCLTSAKQCAVTGMGHSWCDSPTIGPALQAWHIVPQLHYHTYPDPEADAGEAQDGGERASPRRLEQA